MSTVGQLQPFANRPSWTLRRPLHTESGPLPIEHPRSGRPAMCPFAAWLGTRTKRSCVRCQRPTPLLLAAKSLGFFFCNDREPQRCWRPACFLPTAVCDTALCIAIRNCPPAAVRCGSAIHHTNVSEPSFLVPHTTRTRFNRTRLTLLSASCIMHRMRMHRMRSIRHNPVSIKESVMSKIEKVFFSGKTHTTFDRDPSVQQRGIA